MIALQNVCKKYGEKIAVDNLSIIFDQGTVSVLVGPSGCGKTTTLRMINRMVEADTGEIRIRGRSINEYNPVMLRRAMGYVIQEVGLFPHYTVYDNIAVIPRLLKWNDARIHKRVMELLDLVTLDESFCEEYPVQLSGGERQRVGLARALAADPDILLMDEPFGAIDPINRITLQDTLIDIQERIQKTIVLVTHDINEALKVGDRIAIMNEGTLVRYDTPENILFEPGGKLVEMLLGHDRNLKALSLRKTSNFIEKSGFSTVSPEDSNETIQRIFEGKEERVVFIIDSEEKMVGRYHCVVESGEGCSVMKSDDPVYIEKSANLSEALSKMLESGEKVLPVVSSKKRLLGVVTLSSLFDEMSRESDRSNT